jgi:hypothetical protein
LRETIEAIPLDEVPLVARGVPELHLPRLLQLAAKAVFQLLTLLWMLLVALPRPEQVSPATRSTWRWLAMVDVRNDGKLLGDAGKALARFAVILGAELADGNVAVKDLDAGTQTVVSLSELEASLRLRS